MREHPSAAPLEASGTRLQAPLYCGIADVHQRHVQTRHQRDAIARRDDANSSEVHVLFGPRSSGALEDRGDALASTDAHRHQCVPTTGAVQLIDRLRRDEVS